MVQLATKSVIKIDASVAVAAAATGADDAMPCIGFGSSNQAATPLKPSNVWGSRWLAHVLYSDAEKNSGGIR